MSRKAQKQLRAIFEPKKVNRNDELHMRLRPDEAARFRLAVGAAHAESLSSWARQVMHSECDRLGIPRAR